MLPSPNQKRFHKAIIKQMNNIILNPSMDMWIEWAKLKAKYPYITDWSFVKNIKKITTNNEEIFYSSNADGQLSGVLHLNMSIKIGDAEEVDKINIEPPIIFNWTHDEN